MFVLRKHVVLRVLLPPRAGRIARRTASLLSLVRHRLRSVAAQSLRPASAQRLPAIHSAVPGFALTPLLFS
ncbi:hypothetical protein K474DRAFT_1656301 [Panus rudis PR-1116 ss-1]|nr:hypothetical protein K474DRAFT_1656301 [Panus rudis PR-1116 ss-1]